MSRSVDYIIVGAGSAGCVLASRLSEDPDVSILVLEAGGKDRGWQIHMPAALAYPLSNDKANWAYWSEPEPGMDGRRLYCPRGRVLGGSSSINGMAYVRGHARDYDRWGQSGSKAGATRIASPISGRRRPTTGAATTIAATAARCTSPAGGWTTRSTRPGSKQAGRRATPSHGT